MSALDRIIPGSRGPRTTALGSDEVFDVLSNSRRRQVIQYVAGLADGGVTTTSDLAELVAAAEAGPEWSHEDRKRAYIGLTQFHLDKLDEAGVLIQVDEHRFIRGPNAERAQRAVDVLGEVCEG